MTETTIPTMYGDRKLTIRRYRNDSSITVTETFHPENATFAYLSDEQAHALADWIIANVPKPEPTPLTLSEWAEMPIGAEFGFGKWGEFFPCVKVDDWTYNLKGAGYSADIREGTENDLSQGLTWRVIPLPTKFGAIVRSNGKLFTLADPDPGDPVWRSGPGGWLTGKDLRERGFEVIYEGVDD